MSNIMREAWPHWKKWEDSGHTDYDAYEKFREIIRGYAKQGGVIILDERAPTARAFYQKLLNRKREKEMSIRNKKLIVQFDPENIKKILGQRPKLPPLKDIFPPKSSRDWVRKYFLAGGRGWGRSWALSKWQDSINKEGHEAFMIEYLGVWEQDSLYVKLAVEVFALYDLNTDTLNLFGDMHQTTFDTLCAISYEFALEVGFKGNMFEWRREVWNTRNTHWKNQRYLRNTEELNGLDRP